MCITVGTATGVENFLRKMSKVGRLAIYEQLDLSATTSVSRIRPVVTAQNTSALYTFVPYSMMTGLYSSILRLAAQSFINVLLQDRIK